jgi:hypothetical protein
MGLPFPRVNNNYGLDGCDRTSDRSRTLHIPYSSSSFFLVVTSVF